MVLFMFLPVITRVYAPFDRALALIAEMFLSQVSADRLMEIYDAKTAEGSERFSPEGHDIVFENVGFAYDNEQVLRGVSFTAKEGEVTALVGPSGSGKVELFRAPKRGDRIRKLPGCMSKAYMPGVFVKMEIFIFVLSLPYLSMFRNRGFVIE